MEIDQESLKEFKNLPFVKSWQNTFVSKNQNIINTETGKLVEKTLEDFIYIPGPSLLHHFSSDTSFLAFRNENKYEDDWDYNLIADKNDNANRRMAIFYVSKILEALEIKFMVDEGYGLFVEISELAEKAKSEDPVYRDIYQHCAVPKSITTRHGVVESWGS